VLREEQIDIRRQRGVEGKFRIQNLGRNRVFSDYQVTNPASGGQYRVGIRGFDVGDNSCTCPDFRSNTLCTCKHIEAVLAVLRAETPEILRRRKAEVTRPEVFLHYGEALRLGLHLPARHSDQLGDLATVFFDSAHFWKPEGQYGDLIQALARVPEQVTIFSDAMEFMDREIERKEMAERERTLVQQFEAGQLAFDPLKVPLYAYQVRGALFAAYRGRCILGDDMGLGKTVQALAAAEVLAQERGIERVLVVAPASVKYQWETEIRKFTERPVQVIEGAQEQRHGQYTQPTFYRLINYELVLRDLDPLNAWQADLVILDEAQRIKNWETKISRAVKRLRSRYALVLTGTPLENKLEELYSIVQFIDDRRLGPPFQFLHEHRVIDERGKLLGYRNLDKLRDKLAPILLRRTRSEVLGQLPARTDNTVFVEMTGAQRGPYSEQCATLARLLQKKYATEVDRRRVLCCLANLRMLCDSTFLYDKQTHVSPKLEEFAELIREVLTEGGHKAVVFSQWEVMLRETAAVLDRLGIGYTLFSGDVPGRERRQLLERFRSDAACRVFLSTDAGGTGLNLQAADTVINLEVPWNPAVLEQRIARVHRLGQHRPVRVLNLVTRNSIEERVLKTIDLKRTLFEGFFEGTSAEVSFEALGQQEFVTAMAGLLGEVEDQLPAPAPPPIDTRQAVLEAGVHLLEALAGMVAVHAREPSTANGQTGQGMLDAFLAVDARTGKPVLQLPLPSGEILQRAATALHALAAGLSGRQEQAVD
jgi:superfamily II DNA or RNA helicase